VNHIGTKIIETDRLILRQANINDAEDLFCCFNDKTIEPEAHTKIEETINHVQNCINQYENANYYYWVIEVKDIKKTVGGICVINNDENLKSCEIAYSLAKIYWNKGYATEALYHVLRYLIIEVGYNRVQGGNFIDNPASGRVMEKAGMKREGTLRQSNINWKTGKFIDSNIYGLIKEDIK
jgi:ribosomal-protein-alanine N-acetyltransferase